MEAAREFLLATHVTCERLSHGHGFPLRLAAPGRRGFEGKRADAVDWDYYVGKQVPERYRPPGAANPIRFCDP